MTTTARAFCADCHEECTRVVGIPDDAVPWLRRYIAVRRWLRWLLGPANKVEFIADPEPQPLRKFIGLNGH